jgi:hypothetical protein
MNGSFLKNIILESQMKKHKTILGLLHSKEDSQVSNGLKKLETLAKSNPEIVNEAIGYPEIDEHGYLKQSLKIKDAPMALAISVWTLCWRAKTQGVCPTKLRIADYFWNCFFHPIFSPKWLSTLTELKHVIVMQTPLYEKIWWNLCELIHIEKLEFRHRSLFNLRDAITELSKLQELEVIAWDLKTLPSSFAPLQKLRRLKIQCEGKAIKQFPVGITALENLEELILTNSYMTMIPPEIGNLKNLNTLDIGGYFTEIPVEILTLQNLKHLRLHGHFDSFPVGFSNQEHLCHLSLQGKFETLPNEFTTLTSLNYLSLKGKLTSLPPDFGRLTQLQELHLAGNKLTDLPTSFEQLQQLEHLTLDGWNHFRQIPESLFQLKQLKFLYFTGTNIDENKKKQLQEALPNTTIKWNRNEEDLEYTSRLIDRGYSL